MSFKDVFNYADVIISKHFEGIKTKQNYDKRKLDMVDST